MIILLSPAKKMSFETPFPNAGMVSEPMFPERAQYLADKLKRKSPAQLRKMMGISEQLAQLNADRFAAWMAAPAADQAGPAAYVFAGDVYVGLDARSFSTSDMKFAQDRLLILSGLYGLLRPMDAIMPYRLEMGSNFKITAAKDNLYKYWQKPLTEKLAARIRDTGSDFVLDLSSQEYGRAIDRNAIGLPFIRPEFKDGKGGEYRMISYFAKKARGMMAAFAVKNRLKNPEDIRAFQSDGYAWNARLSDSEKNRWVFTRDGK